jgi:hypothetical protein
MLWELGLLSDARLSAAATTLFADPIVRRWWAVHGPTWAFSDSRSNRQFVNIVTTGYVHALAEAEERLGEMSEFPPTGHARTSSRVLIGTAISGAALVAILAMVRMSKRSRRTDGVFR